VSGRRAVLALIAVLAGATPVRTQTAPDRPLHRFEASIGALWLAAAELGARDADLRGNASPTTDFRLFSADTRLEAAPGFDARVGFWLTRSLAIEAGLVRTVPEMRTRVTGDAEDAEDLTLAEDVDQYFIDAAAVLMLDRFSIGTRTVPFVSGGAGYLRQLHEGRTLIETGQAYHVGGGLRHWLRVNDSGFLRALGARVDARLYLLVNGVAFEDGARPHGAISGSFFVTF
jgi:hypothetical protein